ncbi:alpha/beta-Hydrolases superfamily protein isoform X2 [Tasmannia lanceolata]|uniref:alpha/beta-Hydrolases superfamily protein isoform X2 n=1 Tax=Tasmannia lanceolata TaxID=3420 RepID=UPI0040635D5E
MIPLHASIPSVSCVSRLFPLLFCNSRAMSTPSYTSSQMDGHTLLSKRRKHASIRLCSVSSFTTELLEMHSEDPSLHVLFIPGNPGVVSFYKDFVEALYDLLEGNASITAIGYISQTRKNWERGNLFSLQDQINHKVNFIGQELQNKDIPIVLVGHSIGSYISLETFKRLPQQVQYFIGLYPFLMLKTKSSWQSILEIITASQILSASISSIIALLGFFPISVSRFLVRKLLGQSWSSTAVEATCSHLLQYHTIRNVLYLTLTEFEKISEQAPDVALSIEREGHTHSFCCTEAGSVWVARYVANLIKDRVLSSS